MNLPFVEAFLPASAASLGQWRPGDAWLGGGTWLFSEPQPRLRRLLDLRAFGWEPLTLAEDGLELAATCRLSELAEFEPPSDWHAGGLLRRCCEALLGSFKVWNEATVGGNLCLSLPAGPITSLAAALEGRCEIWGPNGQTRFVDAVDFVTGNGTNLLEPGELLRAIVLPERTLRARSSFRQVSRTALGRSAALVIGTRIPDHGLTTITVTAAVSRPLQLRFASWPTAAELRAAIDTAEPPYFADAHGTAEWRRRLTLLLSEQVRQELEAGA
jgi:CO/xanthine dehydrogenase FAD-binding subunit